MSKGWGEIWLNMVGDAGGWCKGIWLGKDGEYGGMWLGEGEGFGDIWLGEGEGYGGI